MLVSPRNSLSSLVYFFGLVVFLPNNFDSSLLILVDGAWSAWGNWTACSKTCSKGVQHRRRLCNSPPPANGGHMCPGPANQSLSCNQGDCPGNSRLGRCVICVKGITSVKVILIIKVLNLLALEITSTEELMNANWPRKQKKFTYNSAPKRNTQKRIWFGLGKVMVHFISSER